MYSHTSIFLLLWMARFYNMQKTSLLVGGDVIFAGIVDYHVKSGNCTYNESFKYMRPIFKTFDNVLVNLENVLGNTTHPPPAFLKDKSVHLIAEPKSVEALNYLGVDAVSLANNHFLDFGESGANKTIDTLKHHNIAITGVTYGPNNKTRQKALIFSKNGVRIAVLSYCIQSSSDTSCSDARNIVDVGPALYRKKEAINHCKQLRKEGAHAVIVFFHWGIEYRVVPENEEDQPFVIALAPYVDVIVGTHQHVPSGHYFYKETLVLWGLGNLLFPMHLTPQAKFNKDFRLSDRNKSKYDKAWYKLTKNFPNLSTESKLVQMAFGKKGLVKGSAKYLMSNINVDKKHCLIVRKKRKSKWTKICSKEDGKCFGITACNTIECKEKKKAKRIKSRARKVQHEEKITNSKEN